MKCSNIKTIKDLKFYLSQNNKIYLLPNNKIESKYIQRFLLDNGFTWRGKEKWINTDYIEHYIVLYNNGKYYIMYSTSNKGCENRSIFNTKKFLKLQQESEFIEQLFENII
jgi:predicted GH43/DUF377 family glycosyl hydrolase